MPNDSTITKEEFQRFCADVMSAPPTTAKMRDVDGNIRLVNLDKCVAIHPSKIAFAMSDPRLRKMIVTQLG